MQKLGSLFTYHSKCFPCMTPNRGTISHIFITVRIKVSVGLKQTWNSQWSLRYTPGHLSILTDAVAFASSGDEANRFPLLCAHFDLPNRGANKTGAPRLLSADNISHSAAAITASQLASVSAETTGFGPWNGIDRFYCSQRVPFLRTWSSTWLAGGYRS